MHLITEDEARRMYFSPDSRPTPSQMARLRRVHGLPSLRLGRRVLYWTDELEAHLKSLSKPQSDGGLFCADWQFARYVFRWGWNISA